jgi:hypothetical protein
MRLDEHPIVPGELKSVHQFSGGKKGTTFGLTNLKKESVVVKFQREKPAEAIAGTTVLHAVKALSPGIRKLDVLEVQRLQDAINASEAADEVKQEFGKATETFLNNPANQYAVVMDYASGLTLKEGLSTGLATFLTVICEHQFQMDLGIILAADAFAGNTDRMFAVKKAGATEPIGWYNEGNTLIQGNRAVAIDNEFQPFVVLTKEPWGRNYGGARMASVASASMTYAKQEAGALFDRFMSDAQANNPGEADAISKVKGRRDIFVTNVSKSVIDTMTVLLRRGSHWKQQFRNIGLESEVLERFRTRKRTLRVLAGGKAPEIAKSLTGNAEYHKWVLMQEMGKQEDEALLILSVQGYKKAKKQYAAAQAAIRPSNTPSKGVGSI